ncbi:MAG: dynamin family protein [Nitrososphaerota archaeon]
MNYYTIFIVGEVSSGKSSFVNAISGGFVSNSSLLRETTNPIGIYYESNAPYQNIKDVTSGLEKIHQENQQKINNLSNLKYEELSKINWINENKPLKALNGLTNFRIIDFPGINDANDTNTQHFLNTINDNINSADLIIFCTDANSAFIKSSEIETFKKIKNMVENQYNKGFYIDLIIVVNKFDSFDNDELNKIYNEIPKSIDYTEKKIFKFSSHKFLIEWIRSNKLRTPIPKFLGQELQKIVKNTNINVTNELKKSVNKENILDGSLIQYNSCIECNFFEEENKKSEESNNLFKILPYLFDFQKSIINKKVIVNHEKIEKYINELKDLYDKFPNIIFRDEYVNKEHIKKKVREINNLINYSQKYLKDYYSDHIKNKIIQLFKETYENNDEKKYKITEYKTFFSSAVNTIHTLKEIDYFKSLIDLLTNDILQNIDFQKISLHFYQVIYLLDLKIIPNKFSLYKLLILYGLKDVEYILYFYGIKNDEFFIRYIIPIFKNIGYEYKTPGYINSILYFQKEPELVDFVKLLYINTKYLRQLYYQKSLIPAKLLKLFEIDEEYYIYLITEKDYPFLKDAIFNHETYKQFKEIYKQIEEDILKYMIK